MGAANVDKAKGRVKQAVGDVTDNDELEREGKLDEASGKAKDTVGKVKDKAEDVVDAVRDKVESASDKH